MAQPTVFGWRLPPIPVDDLPLPPRARRLLARWRQARQVAKGNLRSLLPPRARRWLAWVALITELVGLLAIGNAVTRPRHGTRRVAAPSAFMEIVPCDRCADGLSLTSLALQARGADTLWIIAGTWPSTAAAVRVDVHLQAGTTGVTVRSSARGWALIRGVSDRGPVDPRTVGVALRPGELLVALPASLVLPPVSVSVSLEQAGASLARLPSVGELVWNGAGVPRRPSVTPPPSSLLVPATSTVPSTTAPVTTTPPATTTTSTLAPQVVGLTRFAEACAAVPSGSLDPRLPIVKVGTGTAPDPRRKVPTPWVGGGYATPLPADSAQWPSFSVTAVLLPPGATVPATGSLIDRAGTIQLWAQWDGRLHKGIRRWDGHSSTTVVDAAAADLTVDLGNKAFALFWPSLRAGWRYGFVIADPSGCSATALQPDLAPIELVRP